MYHNQTIQYNERKGNIMKKAYTLLLAIFMVSITLLMFAPAQSQAATPAEIKAWTNIVNLEALPVWFKPGQPIDFVATVKYDGGTQDGFDVGVFHKNRLVAWEMNKRFNRGMNTFKVRDMNFKGDPGEYIVKLRFKGVIFKEKKFITKFHCLTPIFTIDPKATPPAQ
jgi:hypothetical protein